ncbi:MAG: flagellar biosynthetic protein FliO [Pseudomonadota bacterium]|nr:flagellar biosynthetic protein FliO [Pseudomonadota bacterium]
MEPISILRAVLALIFVLVLMGLTAIAAGRGGIGFRSRGAPKERRLEVLASLALDNRRRLVLVRRDKTSHLIMLGAGHEQIIETGIDLPREDRDDS